RARLSRRRQRLPLSRRDPGRERHDRSGGVSRYGRAGGAGRDGSEGRQGKGRGGRRSGARGDPHRMSGTLLVTESTRSYGEFRRRWVRGAFERYVRRYRRRLLRAVERERARGPVTLLTARQLLGDSRVPPDVIVRFYDEES